MLRTIAADAHQEYFNSLPLSKVLGMLDKYHEETGLDISKHKHESIVEDWQIRLMALGVNSTCPHCGSKQISKFGSNGRNKRFQCTKCKKTFSLFTNTILEKTKYSWETWVKVVHLILTHHSIQHIHQVLVEDDGYKNLDYKTVYVWCHKIIHAIAQKPMPRLSGVIQVDETFFRESQKGSRKLKSYVKGEERLPTSKKRATSYGCNGNEFANVVCMIDATGHCVAKVIGLGTLSDDTFEKEFEEYLADATFICADGNPTYKAYCDRKRLPLYVRPSAYDKRLKSAGYKSTHGMSPAEAEKTEEKNRKIILNLYKEKELDYFDCYAPIVNYKMFQEIKKRYKLSLNRVNNLHRYLKQHIEYSKRNVSTKFLQDYVAVEVFQRNYKVDNGRYPQTKKDAESILIDILKPDMICTKRDILDSKMTLSTRTDRGMAILKQQTLMARKSLNDHEFEFDEEDGVANFDKRRFLERIPQCHLDELRKKYGIPKRFVKYSVISALLEQDTIQDDIYKLISERKDKDKRKRQKTEVKHFIEE